jgi:hypothetical protein
MGTLLEQTNNTTYKILLPKNSMFQYIVGDNTTTNKVIMTFRYSQMNLNNITYPLVGFNKVPDITTTTTTNTTNYLDIDWVDYIGVKMFKSIELLIDDNIVEKINPNIFSIYANYILTMYKRAAVESLSTIRTNPDGSFYLNLPIPFNFTLSNYCLPISSMGRSTIKIKFVLEKLENLINNYNTSNNYTKNVIPNIDFHSRGQFDKRLKDVNSFAYTITKTPSMFFVENGVKRKPTIDELKILQGFPKSFKLKGSYIEKWGMIGNSVPPPLTYRIGQKIINCIL